MFGWIPAVAVAFLLLKPPRAALFCMIAGWLFLPMASYELAGLPDYRKPTAVPAVIFLAIMVFDFRRLQSFRPRPVDLPALLFCLAPAVSSLANGLGVYDAASAS
ncbi:MAG TPA: O-antigen ligase domain-containing protein, partial [Planctomycetota bacterium]|nr:O-antigen ligase domain-containing protein [Planctomycetota bacterium]